MSSHFRCVSDQKATSHSSTPPPLWQYTCSVFTHVSTHGSFQGNNEAHIIATSSGSAHLKQPFLGRNLCPWPVSCSSSECFVPVAKHSWCLTSSLPEPIWPLVIGRGIQLGGVSHGWVGPATYDAIRRSSSCQTADCSQCKVSWLSVSFIGPWYIGPVLYVVLLRYVPCFAVYLYSNQGANDGHTSIYSRVLHSVPFGEGLGYHSDYHSPCYQFPVHIHIYPCPHQHWTSPFSLAL